MKAVITLIIALFFGCLAQAQQKPAQVKVETIQMEIVAAGQIRIAPVAAKGTEVARLYRRPGARVKKALDFSTKYDRGIA